jgi:tRNA U34 5-carboxymethylaminomethyl modifying GTPase MnmE/TrmE
MIDEYENLKSKQEFNLQVLMAELLFLRLYYRDLNAVSLRIKDEDRLSKALHVQERELAVDFFFRDEALERETDECLIYESKFSHVKFSHSVVPVSTKLQFGKEAKKQVVIIGDPDTGKTAIVNKLITGRYVDEFAPTTFDTKVQNRSLTD